MEDGDNCVNENNNGFKNKVTDLDTTSRGIQEGCAACRYGLYSLTAGQTTLKHTCGKASNSKQAPAPSSNKRTQASSSSKTVPVTSNKDPQASSNQGGWIQGKD